MRSAFLAAAGFIAFLLCTARAATSANEAHVFYGDFQSVNPAARTFAIKANGKTLVFHYTDKTKLSCGNRYVRWDTIRPGEGTRVVMHLGSGNTGMADEVRIETYGSASQLLSLFRARTTEGEVVTGVAVANYVASEPRGDAFSRATLSSPPYQRQGVFVLAVNPDGSVGQVTAAKSLGDPEFDQRAAQWLRKWRFRPGTVKQVQMPVNYVAIR